MFLSCLCGSERRPGAFCEIGEFLSCLCGSEHTSLDSRVESAFLSCLCGSELDLSECKSLIGDGKAGVLVR